MTQHRAMHGAMQRSCGAASMTARQSGDQGSDCAQCLNELDLGGHLQRPSHTKPPAKSLKNHCWLLALLGHEKLVLKGLGTKGSQHTRPWMYRWLCRRQ